jgi:hypothetical protein
VSFLSPSRQNAVFALRTDYSSFLQIILNLSVNDKKDVFKRILFVYRSRRYGLLCLLILVPVGCALCRCCSKCERAINCVGVNLKRNHNCAGVNSIYLFHLIVDRAVTQPRVINDLTSVYPSRIISSNILQTDLAQVIPLVASNIRSLKKETTK